MAVEMNKRQKKKDENGTFVKYEHKNKRILSKGRRNAYIVKRCNIHTSDATNVIVELLLKTRRIILLAIEIRQMFIKNFIGRSINFAKIL